MINIYLTSMFIIYLLIYKEKNGIMLTYNKILTHTEQGKEHSSFISVQSICI